MLEKIKHLGGNKVIKIAALLALMNAGKASAAELSSPANKTETKEISSQIKDNADNKNSYIFSEADLANMNKESDFEVVKIDFNVNYETDKADLNEKYEKEVSQQFIDFLNNINEDNLEIAKEANWQVFSSCDERKTNAWGEDGNKALAEARGNSIIQELRKVLADYQFTALSAEESAILKNKEIENKIASEHSDRQGETLITDRINPETHQKYTESEVKSIEQNDPIRYHRLLSENRISEFRAEIPVKKLNLEPIEKMPPKISVTNKIDIVNNFIEYKNVIILLDDSPSMTDNKKELGQEIDAQKDNLKDIDLFIGHYSNKLQTINKVEDIDNAKSEIIKIIGKGNSKELSIQSAIEAWNEVSSQIKPNDKTLMIINTDEALQKVSASDLEKLSSLPGNVAVSFIFHLEGGRELKVSLEAVRTEFEGMRKVIHEKIANQIKTTEINLKKTEELLAKFYLKQLQAHHKSTKKQIEQQIEIAKNRQIFFISKINSLYNKMDKNEEINLNKITDESGKEIALNTY